MERVRILLAHRDEDLARSLLIEVNKNNQLEWAGWATTKAETLAVCLANPPQILLLGTILHDASALETIRGLGRVHSPVKIVGLSNSVDPKLIRAMLRAGVSGYVLANEPLAQLLALIPAVLLGKTILSGDIIPLLLQ
jgi:DNA-binding NarL/FixJ family response regulator